MHVESWESVTPPRRLTALGLAAASGGISDLVVFQAQQGALMPCKNPVKRREYQRLWAQGWRASHSKESSARTLRWAAKNREKVREYHKTANRRRILNGKRREYETGCSPERFAKIMKLQNGRCPICKVILVIGGRTGASVAVDHNHKTGKLRGLLCNKCNRMLGFLADDPKMAENAAKYLRMWQLKNGAGK
jgi:hypothetical protein